MTRQHAVVVYSTAFCAPCEHLKRYLRDRDVSFEIKDPMMDEAAAEFLEANDIRSTPVMTVGDAIVIGFDRLEIDHALAAAGVATDPTTSAEPSTS